MKPYTPQRAAIRRFLKALLFCVIGAALSIPPDQFFSVFILGWKTWAVAVLGPAILMGLQKFIAERKRADDAEDIAEEDIPLKKEGGTPDA